MPRALKRGFPLLNNTHALGTPCRRDLSSDALQWGEEETERGWAERGQRRSPQRRRPPPPTPPRAGTWAAASPRERCRPSVATAAADLTPLASILPRTPDLRPTPPLGPARGPRAEPGRALPRPSPGRPLAAPHRARAAQSRKPSAGCKGSDGGHRDLPCPTAVPSACASLPRSLPLPGSHLLVEGVHGLHVGGVGCCGRAPARGRGRGGGAARSRSGAARGHGRWGGGGLALFPSPSARSSGAGVSLAGPRHRPSLPAGWRSPRRAQHPGIEQASRPRTTHRRQKAGGGRRRDGGGGKRRRKRARGAGTT